MMNTQSKKGISPLIATVLLIVFAIAIGAILLSWLGNYTSDTTDKAQQSSNAAVNCAKQGVQISKVYATTANKNLTKVDVQSTGADPVTLKQITASTTGTTTCTYLTSDTTLAPGSIQSFTAATCQVTCNSVDTVRVTTACGSVTAVTTGNATISGC